ncbi:MAG: hypothetical protein IKP06_01240 [Elusimicrobiaceae bacterium]|nr:hypothetical protein [Elusimicrobiaceae bacterium]
MKKIIFFSLLLSVAFGAYARTVEVETSYTGASHFDQAQVDATVALTLNTQAGLQAKLASERIFKDPVYSVAVPLSLDLDLVRISVRPFYYFKNKSDNPSYQDASAYGVSSQLRMTLRDDRLNDIYSHAFVNAAFAREKGTVFFNNGSEENRYYSQTAYSLGLSSTLFNTFGLDLIGTVFEYPDGISTVKGLRSVLNQQELAYLQTLDIVHDLTKYTVGARFTRLWADNGSSFYVSYRYGEFHTADPEHSVMVGNSFYVANRVSIDLAYNHVRTVHNVNHRDIWYIQLGAAF